VSPEFLHFRSFFFKDAYAFGISIVESLPETGLHPARWANLKKAVLIPTSNPGCRKTRRNDFEALYWKQRNTVISITY
jgi:hypothetical protein